MPEKPAVIMGKSGQVVTYGQLDARSNQGAHLFRLNGLVIGDVVAVMLDNEPCYFELAWAAQRAGLYFVGISSRLKSDEVNYILEDCGAKILVTDSTKATILKNVPGSVTVYLTDGGGGSHLDWFEATENLSTAPIADQRGGADMLYSSGTTGRPKGVRAALPEEPDIAAPTSLTGIAAGLFGFDQHSIYLSPAPLYHAAPLRWSMTVQRLGGTVVVMEKYDAEEALKLIERHKITHSQWVPTHFVRMLKLPQETRSSFDISTLKVAIHAAAPCPVPVKQAMIDWWGPILVEYYAGTEGNGMTMINSENWLRKPGSVGRAILGTLHIVDEEGRELGPNEEGLVYYEGGPEFAYHNDPDKTADAHDKNGWSTLGDIGKIDEDGYLFLTDRKSFMIISGGVNIYPTEIENLLVTHPQVADVAVIGAPDPEMGEKVVAVIQPVTMDDANPDFADALFAWLKPQLSGVKMPRQIDFREELPRHPTGKLLKRHLRDEYWP